MKLFRGCLILISKEIESDGDNDGDIKRNLIKKKEMVRLEVKSEANDLGVF